jgi:hypothetical protein
MSQQEMETTNIELECVGNDGNGYIKSQCTVYWFEVLVNDEKHEVECIQHILPMLDYRRKARINHCRYAIPEGVICYYNRSIRTNPRQEVGKWFRVDGGLVSILGDIAGGTSAFPEKFLGSFIERGYKCVTTSGPRLLQYEQPVRLD